MPSGWGDLPQGTGAAATGRGQVSPGPASSPSLLLLQFGICCFPGWLPGLISCRASQSQPKDGPWPLAGTTPSTPPPSQSSGFSSCGTKLHSQCHPSGAPPWALVFLEPTPLCRKPLAGNQEALRRQGSASGKAPALSLQALKHIWVRTALIEKVLDRVVQYLVENCR